ncbi:hypothetical protein EC973_004487 [Apophysomyces ossiformis]|uniref:Thioredoxin domain-containing protein n=1 Tax=Apophysomyces ossiformis TaxID=679940 RepID=A0A8H7BQ49_9FUNG|nr:hypothetical protein EC973_004487 [Apophysomyces ossiformis]
MAEEIPEEKRKAFNKAYFGILYTPFVEKYEENWEEETFWKAVEVFKIKIKEIGIENPFDILSKHNIASYEDIRDKRKAGPPVCTRRNWKSPLVGEKLDVLGFVEKLHHVSGSKYEGNEDIVVLDYWATWCGPCLEVANELSNLADKHTGRLAVIGINNDGPLEQHDLEKARVFIEGHKEKIRYMSYVDNTENFARTLGGEIKYIGDRDWFNAHLEEALNTSYREE